MELKYNIILSIIFLILIIILKITNIQKNKTVNKESIFYKKEQKTVLILSIISIIVLIVSFILNKYLLKLGLLPSILNSISLFVLSIPSSIHNLYNTYIKDEENICYIKTIITKEIISKKILQRINRAHINVVTITTKENKLDLPIYKKRDLSIKLMRKNIIIDSKTTKDIISEYNEKLNFIYTDNPEETYNNIINARGICDNYIRAFKYNLLTYIPLISAIIFINYAMGFPFPYILSLSLLMKLITLITSQYLYRKMPCDTDIPIRKSRDKNIFIYKQEKILMIFQMIPVFMGISLPYTYFIAYGSTQTFANTALFIIIILMNIFMTYVNLSENITIKNFIQVIKNKYLAIYTIILLLIAIALYYLNIFSTERLEINNVIGCIIVAFVFTVCYDIIKFARFTTTKGKNKNEHKNNKKH